MIDFLLMNLLVHERKANVISLPNMWVRILMTRVKIYLNMRVVLVRYDINNNIFVFSFLYNLL